jgi:hypothetical protein
MGRQKGGKIMKIQAEFEDIFRGVELTEREALFLSWITSWDDYTIQNMRTVLEKVRSTLSTLQAENEKLRTELKSNCGISETRLRELAQADKGGKIKAYIVDSFYCDICQKRHARIKEVEVYLTRDAAKAALRREQE